MQHIIVIDYGMGNLRSVSKAFEMVAPHAKVEVTADPKRILSASHVVFPGQGAIGACMAALTKLNLVDVILEVAQKKPFLGICIGMQLLLTHSEENGGVAGLNIIPGEVKHFDQVNDAEGQPLKIPHMGWNQVHQQQDHPMWQQIEQDSRFYFVHSYYATPDDKQVIAGASEYANAFSAAIFKENVFATQFHPEKSQHVGLQLLQNFTNWDGTL